MRIIPLSQEFPAVASGAFPDATTTGVPSGTTLTTVSGDLNSTAANQIIQAKNVSGTIIVQHNGVTVQSCRAAAIVVDAANATVQDCTVAGNINVSNSGITIASPAELGWGSGGPPAADGAKVLRCNISGVENGVWLEASNCLIQDNYFHDLMGVAGAHIDGIQVPNDTPGKASNTIRHNNFDLSISTTSSCCQFDNAKNFVIDHNRFSGGSNELYLLTRAGGTTQGCQVTNNMFVANPFGGLVDEEVATGLNTYTGNTDGNGNPITLP